MIEIIDLFKKEMGRELSLGSKLHFTTNSGESIQVEARCLNDFTGNTKYLAFYIPGTDSYFPCAKSILEDPNTIKGRLSEEDDKILVSTGSHAELIDQYSTTLVFSHRVYFYIDKEVSEKERKHLVNLGAGKGLFVNIRDRQYAQKIDDTQKPQAFVCHDSRDKEPFVNDLVKDLHKMMCPVWYDDYSLKVGDNLRDSIEKGLRTVRKCIIVISPNFINNKGWSKTEFDSIFTRELVEKAELILPVWYNITQKEVFDYCPSLANRVALIYPQKSMGTIVGKLISAIRLPGK